ncbi:MAG: tetratricopeptide repeat protein [Thermodesulfovibrionales bacterium]
MFRRKDNAAGIERKIREAMQKPLTAENLNYIGDLYLRKGEREMTIESYYNAIAKLHVSQQDKMVALFKKILKVSPYEEKAYNGLITLFSKMGLVADEVAYLTALAKLHQAKGDYNKVNSTFRRINALDPDNKAALKYFGKGKQADAAPVVQDADPGMNEEHAAELLSGLPEIGDLADIMAAGHDPVASEGDIQEEERVLQSPDLRSIETESSEIPFMQDGEQSSESPDVPIISADGLPSNNRLYLAGGIAVLLIILSVAGLYVLKRKTPGSDSPVKAPEAGFADKAPVSKPEEAGEFDVKAVRMSDAALRDSGLDKGLGQGVISENQFYMLTASLRKGCLPEGLLTSSSSAISFVDGKGRLNPPADIRGLGQFSRTVYKSRVAGCGENKPVFMKVFIAHKKGMGYTGLSVNIPGKGAAKILTWD